MLITFVELIILNRMLYESIFECLNMAAGSEVSNSSMLKEPSELQGAGKNLLLDSSRPTPSSHVSFSSSRPSSNYNNRPQQVGPQKGINLN